MTRIITWSVIFFAALSWVTASNVYCWRAEDSLLHEELAYHHELEARTIHQAMYCFNSSTGAWDRCREGCKDSAGKHAPIWFPMISILSGEAMTRTAEGLLAEYLLLQAFLYAVPEGKVTVTASQVRAIGHRLRELQRMERGNLLCRQFAECFGYVPDGWGKQYD